MYRAAKIIAFFFKTRCDKKNKSKRRKNLRRNSLTKESKKGNNLRRNSFNNVLSMMTQNMGFKNQNISHEVASKAKESYETMIENSKAGEMCIVEKCFVFIGTTEQSLMLCALKQVSINVVTIDLLRIVLPHLLFIKFFNYFPSRIKTDY